MTDKQRTLFKAGIISIILPFIITFLFASSMHMTNSYLFNKIFFPFLIIGIFLIALSSRYRPKYSKKIAKVNMSTPKEVKFKESTKEEKQRNDNSKSSNITLGLIIIFLALLCFFLLPLDKLIQISQTAYLKTIGIQTSFTIYSLFSVCSSPAVSIIVSQCGLIMFVSIFIFIFIMIGLILIIKGLIKR